MRTIQHASERALCSTILAFLVMGVASIIASVPVHTTSTINVDIQTNASDSAFLIQDWNTTWAFGTDDDDGNDIAMYNGLLYATGYAGSLGGLGSDQCDAWFACLTTAGNVVWNKTWSNGGYEEGNAICVTSNYVYIGGDSYNPSTGNSTTFLLQLDMNGNFIWARSFGYANWKHAAIKDLTMNGTSVFACGLYQVVSHTDNDAFIVEYASNGTAVWSNLYHPSYNNVLNQIIVIGDKIYTAGTYTDPGKMHFQIDDKIGTIYPFYDYGNSTIESSCNGMAIAGGYVYLAGTTNQTAGHNIDMLLVKLTMNCVQAWNKTYHNVDREWGYGVAVDGSNVYLIGQIDSVSMSFQGSMERYNTDGTLLDNLTWGGPSYDEANSMAVSGCNIYVIGGRCYTTGLDWEPSVTRFVLNTAPAITSPADVHATTSSTGNALSWTINDLSIKTTHYSVTKNGTGMKNGTWASGDVISVSIDGLAAGTYDFTILAQDGFGLSATDSALVTITTSEASDTTTIVVIVVVIAAVGGGVVVLFLLNKKGIINLKPKRG